MNKYLGTLLALSFTIFLSFADEVEKIRKELKWLYPKLTIKKIGKSPVPGIYEIWTGDKILYTDGRYIIIGQILSPQGNLTISKEKIYRETMSDNKKIQELLNSIDLSKALKVGNGKKVVVEISDPECPFCRKAENFFKNKKNVSRYVFFMPLAFHKKARPLAVHILCSKDKEATYHQVMSGKFDNLQGIKSCSEGIQKLKEMENIASKLNVRGTPTFFIKTKKGWKKISGANPELINYLE